MNSKNITEIRNVYLSDLAGIKKFFAEYKNDSLYDQDLGDSAMRGNSSDFGLPVAVAFSGDFMAGFASAEVKSGEIEILLCLKTDYQDEANKQVLHNYGDKVLSSMALNHSGIQDQERLIGYIKRFVSWLKEI